MKFVVKCEVLLRLSKVCNFFDVSISEDMKNRINTVRLENSNGNTIAVATNNKIAAIEILGSTAESDGYVDLVLSPELIAQCEKEVGYDGVMVVNSIPELAMSSIQSMMGWSYGGNASYWYDDTPMNNWRSWANSNEVPASKGCMYWDLHHVHALFQSSPSGCVVFPENIDVEKPVTLRDDNAPEWVGLFLPSPLPPLKITDGAELPEWWNK
ncbi:MAG: hypothetical protein CMC15_18715 [Flavobacteriaceae bacterium]|nr:hypothetical protein [Flavobacteriaceae bacterium]|tara:strand:- start:93 stop:728 length:636 start_codon:yes stop_codon:yes gene_type:complete